MMRFFSKFEMYYLSFSNEYLYDFDNIVYY